MVTEIAEIDVTPGQEDAFVEGVRAAAPHFKAATGCRSMKLERSIEHPSRFRLYVGWETVENHMVDFRESEGFQTWRGLVGPYFATPPRVEHSEIALDLF